MRYQITRATKNNQNTIISVNVVGLGELSVENILSRIDSGDEFFTRDFLLEKEANVIIGISPLGNRFIKSAADHTLYNNLDKLPSFSNKEDFINQISKKNK